MWSLEENLIISCLQSSPKIQPAQWVQNKQIDWDNFIRQSTRHAVSGLLHAYSLQRDFKDIFPADINDFLKKVYYKNIVQNMLLLKEVQKILPALHKKGVNPLFVQGMALLLSQSYPSLGMRCLTDIDFIVEPVQLETVRNSLGKLGYAPLPLYPNLMSNGMINLDIHTNIANLERIGSRKYAVNISNSCLWQEACLQEDFYKTAYILSPEDLIITSAAHLQKHSYSRFIWFVDIINITEHYKENLDWQKIVSRTRYFNLQKPLFFTLTFLEEVFNYHSSVEIPGNLLDEKLNIAEDRFLAGLLNGNRLERVGDFLYFFSIKGINKKLLFLKETIFPRQEIMAQVFGFSNPFSLSG